MLVNVKHFAEVELTGEIKVVAKNQTTCHFVHHISQIN